ncbi:flavin monoamine oxidase family protein [Paraburkholderia terrae]|uniref:flavin monoamine oxidase family protein n=1 Tax=Paraburkholderia terrae TaxID=311230 RepID=UPI00296B18CB|nr:FAD-dependent oxidoreductase [Paraburkholderia terrae]MDW3656266.1 FAD-dependent oxidoreductase [Paraburkholderia terrae]
MVRKVKQKIAIIGGGITGLFCAMTLKQENIPFVLFESTDRLGGRIRTIRLRKDCSVWKDFAHDVDHVANTYIKDELDFYAEFGPMRLELDAQPLLKALLTALDITHESKDASVKWKPHLIEFPPYASPASTRDPKYSLPKEERNKAPLDLLTLGLFRIMTQIKVQEGSVLSKKQKELSEHVEARFEKKKGFFIKWLSNLNDSDYWQLQTTGRWIESPKTNTHPTSLYHLGFWNLLSDVLDHSSILKIRDLGTFYHLLPDNPNAAEWLIWWLKGLAFGSRLHGISGGMESIVEHMKKEISGEDSIKLNHKVTQLMRDGDKWVVGFDGNIPDELFDRIIVALPTKPLTTLVRNSSESFEDIEPRIFELLDSALGFPMVKVFAVIDNRWWKEPQRANQFATRMPTRELHYWDGLAKRTPEENKTGMIMAYTDRPATSFWANYAPPGDQDDITQYEGVGSDTRLKRRIIHYMRRGGGKDVTGANIPWYGIRDWGRDPYGAANHAWRPERMFWVVMRRLADIGDKESDYGIHICGEAYSDYHGFMEGSLRSATYAVHRILQRRGLTDLSWLSGVLKENLSVKDLEELQSWIESLDTIDGHAEFIVYE